jgi:hypothetical protein
MSKLNKTLVNTFNKGMDSYYSIAMKLIAPIGHESANSMIGNLTSMNSSNESLPIHGEIEVIEVSNNVAYVKWTQLQWTELNEELESSFDWLERIKLDGHISDWEQLPVND